MFKLAIVIFTIPKQHWNKLQCIQLLFKPNSFQKTSEDLDMNFLFCSR